MLLVTRSREITELKPRSSLLGRSQLPSNFTDECDEEWKRNRREKGQVEGNFVLCRVAVVCRDRMV